MRTALAAGDGCTCSKLDGSGHIEMRSQTLRDSHLLQPLRLSITLYPVQRVPMNLSQTLRGCGAA